MSGAKRPISRLWRNFMWGILCLSLAACVNLMDLQPQPVDPPPPASTQHVEDAAKSIPTTQPAVTPEPSPTASPEPLPEPTATPDPTVIAEGVAIYRANYCGVCHELAAANTRGTFAPNHNQVGLMAEQHIASPGYTRHATTPAEYLLESLVDPQAYTVDGYQMTMHPMPAFTHLSEEHLNALVQMLLLQR